MKEQAEINEINAELSRLNRRFLSLNKERRAVVHAIKLLKTKRENLRRFEHEQRR